MISAAGVIACGATEQDAAAGPSSPAEPAAQQAAVDAAGDDKAEPSADVATEEETDQAEEVAGDGAKEAEKITERESLQAVFEDIVAEKGTTTKEAVSEKGQSVLGGLEPTTGAFPALRGSVIAHTDQRVVTYISFQLSNASETGEAISLAASDVVVSYLDDDQSVSSLGNVANASFTQGWTAVWLSGSGPSLDRGERVEMNVGLQALNPPLGPRKEFAIEIKPGRGPRLAIERVTPTELTTVVDLR